MLISGLRKLYKGNTIIRPKLTRSSCPEKVVRKSDLLKLVNEQREGIIYYRKAKIISSSLLFMSFISTIQLDLNLVYIIPFCMTFSYYMINSKTFEAEIMNKIKIEIKK